MDKFNGYQIFADEHLPELQQKPVKEHICTSDRRNCYHERIQKKWNKRYGFKMVRNVVCFGGSMYAHPNTVALIKKGLQPR